MKFYPFVCGSLMYLLKRNGFREPCPFETLLIHVCPTISSRRGAGNTDCATKQHREQSRQPSGNGGPNVGSRNEMQGQTQCRKTKQQYSCYYYYHYYHCCCSLVVAIVVVVIVVTVLVVVLVYCYGCC